MAVNLAEGETFDAMFRRFTKRVSQELIIPEIRKRQYFESPTSVRKRDIAIKYRKSIKSTAKNA